MDMFFDKVDMPQLFAHAEDEVRDGIHDGLIVARAPRKTPVGIHGKKLGISKFDRMFFGPRHDRLAEDIPSLFSGGEDEMIALLDATNDLDEDETVRLFNGTDDPQDGASKNAHPSEEVVTAEVHDPATCDIDECRECAIARHDFADWFGGYDDGSPKRERIGTSNITGLSHKTRANRLEPGSRKNRRTRSGLTNEVVTEPVRDPLSGRFTERQVQKRGKGMGSFNCGQKPKYKGYRRALHDNRPLPKEAKKGPIKSWITGRDIPLETPIH